MARYSTNDNATITTRNSKVDIFKTPGAYTWVVPTGVTCATFDLVGGGGGGGAKCCCDCYHQGSGGTGGHYVSMTIPVTPGDTYSLCVPYGGMVATVGAEGSHFCCQGGSGGAVYVTGPNITTLCAQGGQPGVNNCYTYCNCADCGGVDMTHNVCSVSSASASAVSCTGKIQNYCNEVQAGTTAGGCHYSLGWVGTWTDSQSQYYPSASGSRAFGSSQISANEYCQGKVTTNFCTSCTTAGGSGAGAITQCCDCRPAGTGRNGQIQVRY